VRLVLVCLGLLLASVSFAATSDTFIQVKYKTHAIRIRPKPVEGDGAANIKIVLHANGTVDDVVEGEGKHPKTWELTKRPLGNHKTGARYRVLNENTIERTFDGKTFAFKVRITVDGKSCKAEVSYTLNPGEKEFEAYSPELGGMAHYSALRPFDVECKIE
jgi:hypothetical protein